MPQLTCETDCSGRHEIDGTLVCSHCKVPMYQIVLHYYKGGDGHAWSEVRALGDQQPPARSPFRCSCGRELTRS